jgi:hypothetical protein
MPAARGDDLLEAGPQETRLAEREVLPALARNEVVVQVEAEDHRRELQPARDGHVCQLSLKVPQGCHRNLPTPVIGPPVAVERPGPTATHRRV